jgi:tetratricopeptide (TPR) repeat protein
MNGAGLDPYPQTGNPPPELERAPARAKENPARTGRNRPLAKSLIFLIAASFLAAAGGGAWLWRRHQEDSARRVSYLHAARGVELREAGNITEAVAAFERAVRTDPRNGQAWYVLSKAREELKPGSGLADLQRAAALAPGSSAVFRDYGVALHEAGDVDAARAALARAVELNPADQAAHAALGRVILARVSGPADLEAGITALRTALTLQPGDVQTRFRLARALYQADDLEPAAGEFRTTLSLLADGAVASTELMDGRSVQSATWYSIVKGCHHYLAQIAVRGRRPEEERRHRRLFDDMGRYMKETYPLFTRLKNAPDDRAAQERLRRLYAGFGLPAAGPDGRSAAIRWIGK